MRSAKFLFSFLLCFVFLAGAGAPISSVPAAPVIGNGIESKTLSELLTLAKSEDVVDRGQAVRELGRRKDPDATETLKGLLKDIIPSIRVDASEALLALGDRSVIPTLKELLNTAPPETALRAAGVLAKYGDSTGVALAKSKLNSKFAVERQGSLDVLVIKKDDAAAYAALQIGARDTSWPVQRHAVWLLGQRSNKRSIEILLPLMSSPNSDVRWMALQAAISTRLWDALPLMINAISDSDETIRHFAAIRLNLLTGQKKTVPRRLDKVKAEGLQREWRIWWEANKQNYPSGEKSPLSHPKAKPPISVPGIIGGL